jgi:hypothetical protein
MQLEWRKHEIYTECWWRNLPESKYLEDQERDGKDIIMDVKESMNWTELVDSVARVREGISIVYVKSVYCFNALLQCTIFSLQKLHRCMD